MASSSTSSTNAKPPWVELPPQITAAILQKLGAVEILTTAVKVCTTWRRVCRDPYMWRYIDMESFGGVVSDDQKVKICRRAVDLSQGQLIGVTINGFGTNDLLRHISRRSGQLKQLSLSNCYNMTNKGVAEAIENLPLLEDLCLQYTSINLEDIETIGRCCPLLKSFKFSSRDSRHDDPDAEARAIAKSIPYIRHLYLNNSSMTDVGLMAIIDGCPQLETLDVRRCFFVKMGGNFMEQYSERIKDIKIIVDSDDDEYRRQFMIYNFNDIYGDGDDWSDDY